MSYVAYSICFLVTPRFVIASSITDDGSMDDANMNDGQDMEDFEAVCNKSG